MLKLLERNIAAIEDRMVLIAPRQSAIGWFFQDVRVDPVRRRRLLHTMQRLRGRIYLQDGAIGPEDLSSDGRHRTPEDDKSWHLLMLDPRGRVSACVWYLEHAATAAFEHLRARHTPLAGHHQWGGRLWRAVESELALAREHQLRYAEVGGWAVSPDCRCTSEGLLLALAAYSLGRIGNGTLGMTTATARHASATILRRLGGAPLEADGEMIPSYFDPRYKCQMELLRFDSRRPSGRYAALVDLLKDKLARVNVLATNSVAFGAGATSWHEGGIAGRQFAAA
jgi:hypothetical protein